jgi:amino acid transporter
MAQDAEMPDIMGLLHDQYATPVYGVIIMVVISGIVATIGVLGGVMALTGITLASNLGTFILYALICGLTVVAFTGDTAFSFVKHAIVPVLGVIVNVVMVLAIFVIGIQSGGVTAQSTFLALGIGVGWLLISVAYFFISSARKGVAILPSVNKVTAEDL